MTDSRDDADDTLTGAPIDFDRLDVIQERFSTDERFAQIDEQPEFAPERLVCVYNQRSYPTSVRSARIEIAWFENGDFSLHYHEEHQDGVFDHRWDRHPSAHNTRDHVHPGPDAPTPGVDASHPPDWRDVLSMVLTSTLLSSFIESLFSVGRAIHRALDPVHLTPLGGTVRLGG